MSEYREIITKAVVAKGRKFTQCTNTISPEKKPSSIWVVGLLTTSMTLKKLEKR